MSHETSSGTLIGIEKSKAWVELLSGKIPEEVTVYLILWQDRDSKRFVDYGFYLSTSEPGPLNTDPLIVCELPVPVVASCGRAKAVKEDLHASTFWAAHFLARKFALDASCKQLFEKFSQDSRYRANHKMPPMEVLPPREYEELMRSLKGDWEARARDRDAAASPGTQASKAV